MLNTLEFCIYLDQKLVPRAHKTHRKSLAPFWIISGVGSVQPLINQWRCTKIQLNWRKYQTISEKSQTWCFLHPWHVQAWKKVWDPYDTGMHMNHWNLRNLRCLVIVPLDGFYRFVKQVCIVYVQMSWIFFCNHVHPNYSPTQDLRFFWSFFYYYIFLCARWDKRGPITCWTQ
jgi:hypothetical protein